MILETMSGALKMHSAALSQTAFIEQCTGTRCKLPFAYIGLHPRQRQSDLLSRTACDTSRL